MPSPFPGMNPYLEQDAAAWHDFHERFIPLAADLIGEQLNDKYVVRIDEHVYIHELADEGRQLLGRGDVVARRPGLPSSSGSTTGVEEAPVLVRLPAVDEEGLSFVEIRTRDDWKVRTVIELLSPANKNPGSNRQQYLGKRWRLLASPVHFVEIDLLRAGPRMPFVDLPECDYYVMVSRSPDRPLAGLYPIKLRDRLPTIPIPLQEPDPDARLDLQAMVHRIYDAGRYRIYLYESEPVLPLEGEVAEWAKQFVPAGSQS